MPVQIIEPSLTFNPSTPPNAIKGVPYNQTFEVLPSGPLNNPEFVGDSKGLSVELLQDSKIRIFGTPNASGATGPVIVSNPSGEVGVL